MTILAALLASRLAVAQDKSEGLPTDMFPRRSRDTSERTFSGFYGSAGYEYVKFAGNLQDVYNYGMVADLEGGYWWELHNGIFVSVGGFAMPRGNAYAWNGGVKDSIDFDLFGGVLQLGNGLEGWHFGAEGRFGVASISRTLENAAGTLLQSTSELNFLYGGGIFAERNIFDDPSIGLLLSFFGGYMVSTTRSITGQDIGLWTIGGRLVFTLR